MSYTFRRRCASWPTSCSMVHQSEFLLYPFKKDLKLITGATDWVFIPLMRYPMQGLVWRSFLVILTYSFLTFTFIIAWTMMPASNIPSCLYFYFFPNVLILSWLNCSISSVVSRLPFFDYKPGAVFNFKFYSSKSDINSNILRCLIRFILGKYLNIIHIHDGGGYIFLRLCKCVASLHFLSIKFSYNIAIVNSSRLSESCLNILI